MGLDNVGNPVAPHVADCDGDAHAWTDVAVGPDEDAVEMAQAGGADKGRVGHPLDAELFTVNQLAVRQLNLSVDQGILVVRVYNGSPAAQAGLEPGDVIVSIGGEDVAGVQELT